MFGCGPSGRLGHFMHCDHFTSCTVITPDCACAAQHACVHRSMSMGHRPGRVVSYSTDGTGVGYLGARANSLRTARWAGGLMPAFTGSGRWKVGALRRSGWGGRAWGIVSCRAMQGWGGRRAPMVGGGGRGGTGPRSAPRTLTQPGARTPCPPLTPDPPDPPLHDPPLPQQPGGGEREGGGGRGGGR